MNVTRDVVKDLLTPYLAGDASADTRRLVEQWLRSDPELSAEVEQARRDDLPAVGAPPPGIEKTALERTRRFLNRRAVALGAAIYFSTLPLSVTFGSDGFRGFLLEEWWSRAVAIVAAVVCWGVYWRMRRPLAPAPR